jgi:SAM-dependent methyltransferase
MRTTPAGDHWRSLIAARQAQSERLRETDWTPPGDFTQPRIESFRAFRERTDDRAIVEALLPGLRSDDSLLDVGAGAGRFTLPFAQHVRQVIAVEPSPAMGAALLADAERAGISNVQLLPARWETAKDVTADVAFSSHVLYAFAQIELFLRRLDAAARRWAAVVLFAETPLSWLSPFWPLVHGEERLPAPHLPQLLDVLRDLGLGPPRVTLIDVEPFPLGPSDVAYEKLRRRLDLAPGSAGAARLQAAMQSLLIEQDGVLVVHDAPPVQVGLVQWDTRR